MKSRSQHRLPTISDPPDDWGDGSWTVDCVCGVTFDDGEEMVNCDECGVWVHTRCSRFVKGEKSFACDKCKNKKGRNDNSEETEVAQLLVELPTKTMRMDSRPASVVPPPPCPPRFKRLWTDIPMEERVHVQGVPGGDSGLFEGFSSVFSPELWKCNGYVPKKFNFQYKDFSCWEDEDVDKKGVDLARAEEDNENPVDRGADVLFSLSKEIVPYAPQMGAMRGFDEGGGCERNLDQTEMKRRDWGEVGLSSGRVKNGVKRERNQLRSIGVHLGKRKTDELGISKERSGKKKSRSADREATNKKRGFASATDAHKLDFLEREDFKVVNSTGYQDTKSEDGKETLLAERNYEGHLEAPVSSNEPKSILFAKAHAEVFCDGALEHNFSPETLLKVENIIQQAPIKNGISPRTDASEISLTETNGVTKISIKEEGVSTAVDGLNHLKDEGHNMGDLNGDSTSIAVDSEKSKPPYGDQGTVHYTHKICMVPDSNGVLSLTSVQTNAKVKIEADDGQATGDAEVLCSIGAGKPVLVSNSLQHFVKSDKLSENLQVHDMPMDNLQSGEHNSQDAERMLEAVSYPDTKSEGMVSISDEPHHIEQESSGPLTVHEGSLKSRYAKYIEETSKIGATNPSPPAPSLRKLVVGIGKSSASSTIVLSKSSVSDNYKSVGTASSPAAMETTNLSKQRLRVKSSTDHKKDNVALDAQRDESKQKVPAPVKPKSPANYGLKPSHASRTSHSSASKHSLSDAKDQVFGPPKASSKQNVANFSGKVELLSQTQIASQNKPAASNSYQKSEKMNQSSSQPSSKVSNHSSSVHPPAPVNALATLSDEELALLLHQELNSSPRVPRVPRVRHAGSVTQLSSPTGTSMLAKRSYSSGGKDHISVTRRKNKEEASKDNSRNPRELTDETKKPNRFSSSPDQRRPDSVSATDGLTKRDSCNRSLDGEASTKNIPLMSSTLYNGGPSSSIEANDQTLSSLRSSPRDFSDDDGGGVSGSTRTLPGLIDEIMSKGKRMTYEELCNAVLPHWHNLRKHNGERYAYSSHSQAVLDCLRNRNEWAQLIDRGPKTNSSRKRRKLDADTSVVESENEYAKGRPSKQIEGKSVESHREEFPKGKRKARKRRRLQLQGSLLNEVRKRHKADAVMEDDFGDYSSEGSESIFSEDEKKGTRTGEASSSSSDET